MCSGKVYSSSLIDIYTIIHRGRKTVGLLGWGGSLAIGDVRVYLVMQVTI